MRELLILVGILALFFFLLVLATRRAPNPTPKMCEVYYEHCMWGQGGRFGPGFGSREDQCEFLRADCMRRAK